MPLIKRYSNRKLYDTQAKRYITLDVIADMIRRGDPVQVTEHSTGEDITPLIQAQIIFELERKLKGGLPGAVLTGLIQSGSSRLNQIRQAILPPDWKERVDAEIERRIQNLIRAGELPEEEGLALLDKLLETQGLPYPLENTPDAEIERLLKDRGLPTRDDLQALAQRVDELAGELGRLNASPARASKPKRFPRKNIRASARKKG